MQQAADALKHRHAAAPQEALQVAVRDCGEKHPMTATLLGHLARVCCAQGKNELGAQVTLTMAAQRNCRS